MSFPLTDLEKLDEARRDAGASILRQRRKVNDSHGDRSQRIKRRMEQFSAAAENIEFKDRLIGDFVIPGYNGGLYAPFERVRDQLLKEDLPKNQQRFESLLHSTVTDDVTVFDELLERHAKRIERKIVELNQQLRKIDFDRREKTYIQLVPSRTDEAAVKEFRTYGETRCRVAECHQCEGGAEGAVSRYRTVLNKLDEAPNGRIV